MPNQPRSVDDVLDDFERNPLGQSEKEMRALVERQQRTEKRWVLAFLISASFGAGYYCATHDWIEILIAIVLLIVSGAILTYMVKHHGHDGDDSRWEI